MTRDEFITQLQDVLQTESVLTMETVLEDLDEWDSLSMMATMVFLDEDCGVKMKMADIKKFRTVREIAEKAGVQ